VVVKVCGIGCGVTCGWGAMGVSGLLGHLHSILTTAKKATIMINAVMYPKRLLAETAFMGISALF
jgi:hypothetical protein